MEDKELIIFFTIILIYQSFIPVITTHNMIFSVSIDLIDNIKKAYLYKKVYILVGMILTVTTIILGIFSQNVLLMFSIISILILIFLFEIFHSFLLNQAKKSVNKRKNEKNIALFINNIIPTIPSIFFIFPIYIVLGTWILLIEQYNKISTSIPIHWNIALIPDAFINKGLWNISKVPLMALLIIVLLFIFNLSLSSKSQNTILQCKEQYIKIKLNSKRYYSLFLSIFSIFITLLFLLCEISILYPRITIQKELIWASMIICSIIYFIYIKKSIVDENKFMKEFSIEETGLEFEEKSWILGLIYFNRTNPSLIVSRRTGVGYTLNFGSPYSWIILVILFVFILFV